MELPLNKQSSCCDGCLSADRKLVPVGNLSSLIHMLFDSQKDCIRLNVLCWECANMLAKIRLFRQRVLKAQAALWLALSNEMKTLPDTLSNLCMKINTDITVVRYNEKSPVFVENIEGDACHKQAEYDSENDFDVEKFENNSHNEECDSHKGIEFKSRIKGKSMRSDERLKRKYERKAETIREKFTSVATSEYFKKVNVTEEEIIDLLESEKQNFAYVNRPFKCEKCVCGFVTEQAYTKHNEHRHRKENGPYTCSVCETHLPTRRRMREHWNSHLRIYECTLCEYKCLHKNVQKRHLRNAHSVRFRCRMCSSLFLNRNEFNDHYKNLHMKLICDHCGRKFSMKRSIENHIKRNHGSRDCKICHRHYKTYHSLENHYRMRHPFMINKNLKNEDSYCVECDKQFDSVYKYKNHLRTSVRHTPPKKISVPCPECGKVFSKKTYMKNHHKLAHIKQSEHHCLLCDKFFVTAFSLRQHKQTVHDKIAIPRDKICNVCGRAFNANRNLIYHMRTHTGERPFSCEYCSATFAQKISMKCHIKTVHLKDKVNNQFLPSINNTIE